MATETHQRQLSDEIGNVVDTLHGLFEEIGLAQYDCEQRESGVYAAISAALNEQLRVVVQEKENMIQECQQILAQTRQMERSMADDDEYEEEEDEDHQITMPLLKCLQGLKERHKAVMKRYADRYDSVKQLAAALDTYASRLEPSIIQIELPPITNDPLSIAGFDLSHTYSERLETEFNRVYEEFTRRVSTVESLAKETINLYAELGIPSAQTDRAIIEYGTSAPERLGLTKEDIERLISKKDKLVGEKERRRVRTDELKRDITELWGKLGVPESDKKLYLAQHRGYDPRTIQELEKEHHRLLELKKAHMHIFVEDARHKLQQLWEKLYFSEDEMLNFSPAQTNVYTDALLQAHEMEIHRLEIIYEECKPVLTLINKHRELMEDKEQLALLVQDSSRLMSRGPRDPTRLLREEKMRKRIAKELPRVEIELRKALESWEEENGEPFLVRGEPYLGALMRLSPAAQSRAATRTPATNRGRSNTASSMSSHGGAPGTQQRAKSRPNVKEPATEMRPPPRSKTPGARPKTPAGGALINYSGNSSTIGRTGGKNFASQFSGRTGTPMLGNNTPCLGGSIPRPISSNASASPTRGGRPTLSSFMADSEENEEMSGTTTIGRNASVRHKFAGILGATPKMLPLSRSESHKQMTPWQRHKLEQDEANSLSKTSGLSRAESCKQMTPYQRHKMEQEQREQEETRSSRGSRSIRSVSPFENEASTYRAYGDASDHDESRSVPRGGTYRPSSKNNYMGGQFSASTLSSTSSISTPDDGGGSENWETFGAESEYGDDTELDPRASYYRERARDAYEGSVKSAYEGSVKSVGLVSNDGWRSDDGY